MYLIPTPRPGLRGTRVMGLAGFAARMRGLGAGTVAAIPGVAPGGVQQAGAVVSPVGSPVVVTTGTSDNLSTPGATAAATPAQITALAANPPGTLVPIVNGIVTPTAPIQVYPGPISITPVAAPAGTAPAASPVPSGYPTDQIYVSPSGAFYEYNSTSGQWVDVGTPYNTGAAATAGTTSTYANSPVPSTWPTDEVYQDSSGNEWVYNGQSWTNYGPTSYFPGTSIPITTPTNEIYTDALGNQWSYSNGNWQLIASPSSTTSALTAAGTPTQGATSVTGSPAPVSGTESLLDWFSESTLISGVPNWVLAAGAGLLALKLMKRGR
jgi:hypothetical protein